MICCCTGHRPKGFPWKYGIDKEKQTLYEKELYERLERYIIETGITEFISGMALGADMDYAAAVLRCAKNTLISVCIAPSPARDQTRLWKEPIGG